MSKKVLEEEEEDLPPSRKAQGDDIHEELVFGKSSQATGKYKRRLTYNLKHRDREDQILANTIESHLESTGLVKPFRGGGASSTASSRASASTASSPSPGDGSTASDTRERKGVCITVVSRCSRHASFPSSPAHTYATFFRAALSKTQVDAVLEEQFRGTAEANEGKRRKKYHGEHNEGGERHGYGIYTSRNGNEYRGEWQNDGREGLGVVKIGNGDVFEGQFEDNLKNGIGVYHFVDGECDLSLYRDDARVGDSLRYSADRRRAFLLPDDSSGSEAVSLEEAARVAKEMGSIVEY